MGSVVANRRLPRVLRKWEVSSLVRFQRISAFLDNSLSVGHRMGHQAAVVVPDAALGGFVGLVARD